MVQEQQTKIKKLKEIETQLQKLIELEEATGTPQNRDEYILQLEETRLHILHLELEEMP